MIEIGHFKFKFRRYDFISHQNSMQDKLFNTFEVDEDNICFYNIYYYLKMWIIFFIWFDRN